MKQKIKKITTYLLIFLTIFSIKCVNATTQEPISATISAQQNSDNSDNSDSSDSSDFPPKNYSPGKNHGADHDIWIEAAKRGNLNVMKSILPKYPDIINYTDPNNKNRTALIRASYNRQRHIIDWLLKNGANPNQKDEYGEIYTDVLYHSDWLDAAKNGKLKRINRMLSKNPSLLNYNRSGWTALHEAAFWDEEDIYNLLIAKGIDQTIKPNNGQTAKEILEHLEKEKKAALATDRDTDSDSSLHLTLKTSDDEDTDGDDEDNLIEDGNLKNELDAKNKADNKVLYELFEPHEIVHYDPNAPISDYVPSDDEDESNPYAAASSDDDDDYNYKELDLPVYEISDIQQQKFKEELISRMLINKPINEQETALIQVAIDIIFGEYDSLQYIKKYKKNPGSSFLFSLIDLANSYNMRKLILPEYVYFFLANKLMFEDKIADLEFLKKVDQSHQNFVNVFKEKIFNNMNYIQDILPKLVTKTLMFKNNIGVKKLIRHLPLLDKHKNYLTYRNDIHPFLLELQQPPTYMDFNHKAMIFNIQLSDRLSLPEKHTQMIELLDYIHINAKKKHIALQDFFYFEQKFHLLKKIISSPDYLQKLTPPIINTFSKKITLITQFFKYKNCEHLDNAWANQANINYYYGTTQSNFHKENIFIALLTKELDNQPNPIEISQNNIDNIPLSYIKLQKDIFHGKMRISRFLRNAIKHKTKKNKQHILKTTKKIITTYKTILKIHAKKKKETKDTIKRMKSIYLMTANHFNSLKVTVKFYYINNPSQLKEIINYTKLFKSSLAFLNELIMAENIVLHEKITLSIDSMDIWVKKNLVFIIKTIQDTLNYYDTQKDIINKYNKTTQINKQIIQGITNVLNPIEPHLYNYVFKNNAVLKKDISNSVKYRENTMKIRTYIEIVSDIDILLNTKKYILFSQKQTPELDNLINQLIRIKALSTKAQDFIKKELQFYKHYQDNKNYNKKDVEKYINNQQQEDQQIKNKEFQKLTEKATENNFFKLKSYFNNITTSKLDNISTYLKQLENTLLNPKIKFGEITLKINGFHKQHIKFSTSALSQIATHISLIFINIKKLDNNLKTKHNKLKETIQRLKNKNTEKKTNNDEDIREYEETSDNLLKNNIEIYNTHDILSQIKQIRMRIVEGRERLKQTHCIRTTVEDFEMIINTDYYIDFASNNDKKCRTALSKVTDHFKKETDLKIIQKYIAQFNTEINNINKQHIDLKINFIPNNQQHIKIQKNYKFTLIAHIFDLQDILIEIYQRLVDKKVFFNKQKQLFIATRNEFVTLKLNSIKMASNELILAIEERGTYYQKIIERYFPNLPPVPIGLPLTKQALSELSQIDQIKEKKIKSLKIAQEKKDENSAVKNIVNTLRPLAVILGAWSKEKDYEHIALIMVGRIIIIALILWAMYITFKIFQQKTLKKKYRTSPVNLNHNTHTPHTQHSIGKKTSPNRSVQALKIFILIIIFFFFLSLFFRKRQKQ